MRILRKISKPTVTPVATTPYAVLPSDMNIYVDATGATSIVTLPAATGSGRLINIKKIDSTANQVVVTANVTGTPDTIDGDPTYPLVYQWGAITVQDAAVNKWYVL